MTASEDSHRPQTTPGGEAVSISVFFPCYNEQDNVRRVVAQAVEVLESIGADFDVIVVNDGSTDRTGAIADELAAADPRIRVVHHEQNLGYGRALRSGFAAASKELVFYTDGDAQFDLVELPPLLGLMKDFDIVSGYRANRRDNFVRRIGGRLWTLSARLCFGLHIRDVDCAFKLYKRAVFDQIHPTSSGALIDTEILARAARKGFRIVQKPVTHYPRTAGKQTGGSVKVVLKAFWELLKLRRRILKGE